MFMQVMPWLSEGRLQVAAGAHPRVIGARFDCPTFSPAIEEPWISEFAPRRQV
jgi:hypothetical protein